MAIVNCELVRKVAEYFNKMDYGLEVCSCDYKELLWQHMKFHLCGVPHFKPCDDDECLEITTLECGIESDEGEIVVTTPDTIIITEIL
jgi:hypothetical protein